MKLKPIKKGSTSNSVFKNKGVVLEDEQPKKGSSKKTNKLPSDEYKPMFTPLRFLVREYPSFKDPTKWVKDYIEVSVKRWDDDEAPACCFMTMYRESEAYTGYLKGKSVHFPVEMFGDVIENLQDACDECDKRNIE